MNFKEAAFNAYALLRGVNYHVQSRFMNNVGAGVRLRERSPIEDNPELVEIARNSLFQLLKKDSARFADGTYPLAVHDQLDFIKSWKSYPSILLDALKLYKRRNNKVWNSFRKLSDEELEKFPPYYRRDYHFQQDGYFSRRSASIYEHQVEVLFAGSANPMRRMLLPRLLKFAEGRSLKILEVAAGTGIASSFVAKALPQSEVWITDLSPYYVAHARAQYIYQLNMNFAQANVLDLPFSDEKFDVVYSVFLQHEMPRADRLQGIQEMRRVLKPGGLMLLLDSVQSIDAAALSPLIQQFPKEFHEPYFKDYVSLPLEQILQDQSFSQIETEFGFLSKCASGIK